MADAKSTSSYIPLTPIIGEKVGDDSYILHSKDIKNLNDTLYYMAKLIQGGLNLANLNKATNQKFTDIEGNVTTVTETAAGLTVSVSALSGDVSTISATVDGLSIADETGSYTIIDGDKLTSFDHDTLSWVVIENGQVVLQTQGNTVVGGLYFDANESKIILKSDWFMPLKLISAANISVDANSGSTVYLGTSNSGEDVEIGNSGGTVAINGSSITVNGNPLGTAVFS